MVRKASGDFSTASPRSAPPSGRASFLILSVDRHSVDASLEDVGRLEHHHPPRRDRNLFTGLRIAADPLSLGAHHERPEGRQLHRFPLLQAFRDLLEDAFHELSRFGAGKAHFLVDGLAQIRPSDGVTRHGRHPPNAIPPCGILFRTLNSMLLISRSYELRDQRSTRKSLPPDQSRSP